MRGKHVFDKNPTFDNPVFTISLENVNEHVVAEERDQDQVCRSNPGDNMTIDSRSRTAKWNLLAEVLITCTACTSLILIELGLIPNYRKSGFYCDDPNIRFKYSGQTIGTKILLLVTTILPLISITTIERSCHGPEGYAKRGGGRWAWLTQSLRWYKEFLSGLIIVIFVTEVAKLTIGEPRPHFIDTCRPIQAMNCSSGYVSEYTCTNKDVSLHSLIDASRSFPSGHASVSFYLFVFMAWFIERRVTSVGQLVIAWLQISVLVWTLLCSLTRITDHKHHWWDVLAGSILGVLVGQYIVKKFCKDFQLTMYHGHISGAKHIENKASRQLYNNNTSARRLLTSASGYNNEPPTRDQSDQSLT